MSRSSIFPPKPPTLELRHQILTEIGNYCLPANFEERGCAVCGRLRLTTLLRPLAQSTFNQNLLIRPTVTRIERKSSMDPIKGSEEPILAPGCTDICNDCETILDKGSIPINSLANGQWIGIVPNELQGLTYAESLLVARIRHNRCVVRVKSGRGKLIANAVMFANPTAKIAQVLPPPRHELNEILAFVFMGSAKPTEDELKRIPLLVRRNKVAIALNWLKLNHQDYYDLNISAENLATYPLSGVPIEIQYMKTDEEEIIKDPLTMSDHDTEETEGTNSADQT
ncbi:hypothetical protein K435DRAFT_667792 [Dendrothele bispora CBS 962.96]|uniref:DUF6570 domain-containing protein n=1 Tax=Dendrothele bispora (strain CBS 962.96) TaxID=1314807 RepID=A0A4S8LZ39_DENBC|nr:hypothetical protein K435DRAFT_667792 [Dendrothele bispora CBS 962.96]